MKKILVLILCLMLACGGAIAENQAAPAPGEKLGLNLLSMLHVTGENTILSPQSLTLALGMAAEGAQGNTLEEILAALGVEDASWIAASLLEGLKCANAAFTAPGLELSAQYVDRLNALYDAQWFEMDGNVVEKVNAWVREHTDELIENMLSEAPDPGTGMILLNAVAMDAAWASPFSPEATGEEVFHAPGGDVQVQMMHQREYFDYAEKDGIQIVRLPYRDSDLEMWIALPPEGAVFQLLEMLASEGMDVLRSDVEAREVALGLPKMDVADANTLSDALKLLGVETAFSDAADFSVMSDVPMCIDEVLQKVRVQVDEDGTRAAAATALIMKTMAMQETEPPVEMTVNRPFVFVIADARTGAVCFAGAIENPAKN